MPALQVHSIAIALGGDELVSDVSFTLESGSCLGIVGETGCGKTLTCRLLTGTLNRIGASVKRGSARFGETDLATLGDRGWRRLRGRSIGLVPQSSLSGLDPVMSVGHQLTETVAEIGNGDDPRRTALELLLQVRMPRVNEVFRAYPHELSGGMRQRVMIALALAGRPDLLIADEPTTALDVTVQKGILDLIGDLRRETGMSVLLVTHDLAVVEEITDSVMVMYAGTTVESGTTMNVLDSPSHPYTRALLAARPGARGPGERLADIPGHHPGPSEWPNGCRFAPRCAHALPACSEGLPELRRSAADHRARCVRLEELAGVG